MKSRLVSHAPAGVRVVILDSGEEACAALIGWFDLAAKNYRKIEVNEQCEVLSAIGDVAEGDDGRASLHVHVVLGLSDGSTRGGHFLSGIVRPTLEVVLTEAPATFRRTKRPGLGIALVDLGAGDSRPARQN